LEEATKGIEGSTISSGPPRPTLQQLERELFTLMMLKLLGDVEIELEDPYLELA
jgi:hypothetical protein